MGSDPLPLVLVEHDPLLEQPVPAHVGPPFAVALPKDPGAGFAPYRLETMGDYLPPSVDILALKQMRDAAPAAPALTAAPTTVDPVRDHEPRWDPERQAYVRWNGLLQEWVVFDEDQREWVRAH